MEFTTQSASETKKLGQKFGANLISGGSRAKCAQVLALVGDLGSGKTTFVQGLAEGLGIRARVISPTFILLRNYGNLYHIDLYRLEEDVDRELRNLGFEDLVREKDNVVVIEWAEKARETIPDWATWIEFENLGGNRRGIKIS